MNLPRNVSQGLWCIGVNALFLFVSIITICAFAEEIAAGRYVALYVSTIIIWAPVCASFVVLATDFFLNGKYRFEQ